MGMKEVASVFVVGVKCVANINIPNCDSYMELPSILLREQWISQTKAEGEKKFRKLRKENLFFWYLWYAHHRSYR